MSNGDPIIIKGGSIEITLYKDTFPEDSENRSRHYNANRKIVRVQITDDNTGESTDCAVPANGICTLRIYHSNK